MSSFPPEGAPISFTLVAFAMAVTATRTLAVFSRGAFSGRLVSVATASLVFSVAFVGAISLATFPATLVFAIAGVGAVTSTGFPASEPEDAPPPEDALPEDALPLPLPELPVPLPDGPEEEADEPEPVPLEDLVSVSADPVPDVSSGVDEPVAAADVLFAALVGAAACGAGTIGEKGDTFTIGSKCLFVPLTAMAVSGLLSTAAFCPARTPVGSPESASVMT